MAKQASTKEGMFKRGSISAAPEGEKRTMTVSMRGRPTSQVIWYVLSSPLSLSMSAHLCCFRRPLV